RDWPDFARRVAASFPRYAALGLTYSDGAFAVGGTTADEGTTTRVTLSKQAPYGEIRYTLDGSEPTAQSPAYTEPFPVVWPTMVRASTFAAGERISHVSDVRADGLQRRTSGRLELCGNAIALALEDDAPRDGPRAVIYVD